MICSNLYIWFSSCLHNVGSIPQSEGFFQCRQPLSKGLEWSPQNPVQGNSQSQTGSVWSTYEMLYGERCFPQHPWDNVASRRPRKTLTLTFHSFSSLPAHPKQQYVPTHLLRKLSLRLPACTVRHHSLHRTGHLSAGPLFHKLSCNRAAAAPFILPALPFHRKSHDEPG